MGPEKITEPTRSDLLTLAIHCLKPKGGDTDFWSLPLEDQLGLVQETAFPEQNAFILDDSQFLAALCTRRAGKSNGLASRFMRTMLKHPGAQCRYIALTRDSAKDIMWTILQEHDEKYKIGSTFTESNLTMSMPNGATLRLFGADMKNFIKRLKGVKSPGVAIDEVQDFGPHIQTLIDDVLTPTISDYPDGWLSLTGTPGPIPSGFFYEVTELAKDGYNIHKWSLYQNPYFPNPTEFVAKLKKKKAWDESNPTYQREWLGKWVMDLDALVIKYKADRNHFEALPEIGGQWDYVIGADIGFHDADAISVLGWNEFQKSVYLVEEVITSKQGITALAGQLDSLIKKYQPIRIVMDTGGLGKKIAEEIRSRYSLPIQAAEKTRKFEYIELLNDALRTGRFLAKKNSRFASDSQHLKWDTEETKLKVSDHFHSDIIDAVLYAFRESLHWLSEPEPLMLKPGAQDWLKHHEDVMEESAQEILRQRNQDDDFWRDTGWN